MPSSLLENQYSFLLLIMAAYSKQIAVPRFLIDYIAMHYPTLPNDILDIIDSYKPGNVLKYDRFIAELKIKNMSYGNGAHDIYWRHFNYELIFAKNPKPLQWYLVNNVGARYVWLYWANKLHDHNFRNRAITMPWGQYKKYLNLVRDIMRTYDAEYNEETRTWHTVKPNRIMKKLEDHWRRKPGFGRNPREVYLIDWPHRFFGADRINDNDWDLDINRNHVPSTIHSDQLYCKIQRAMRAHERETGQDLLWFPDIIDDIMEIEEAKDFFEV